ncbi:MAG: polymer-forming cytoskeletal protein [Myxococcota bacterium]
MSSDSQLDELHALLGRGTEFRGKLAFEGRVRIDGKFVGEVFSEDLLILGREAEVEGQVDVGTLIVQGGIVRGDVTATQLIEVHSPARIEGTLTCPQLYIERGVTFEGKCTMNVEETQEFDDGEDAAPAESATAGGEKEPRDEGSDSDQTEDAAGQTGDEEPEAGDGDSPEGESAPAEESSR